MHEVRRFVLQDLKVAALFLTRFPVPMDGSVTMRDLARAVYAFPVMGAAVGLLGGLGFMVASWVGLPSLPGALIALVCMIVATGALHEDGLADTADGLGAGPDREKALAIMRDSRIGSYGAIAIMLSLLGRLMALAPMWDPKLVTAVLVGAGMTSRAMMPVVMLLQPSAKATGLAAEAGRPDAPRVAIGLVVSVLACLVLLPIHFALPALLSAALAALLLATWLGRRFGGCTGDTLGAVQQVGELAFLFAIVSRL
ncbi:adenosylcobinamide-GDP ribazoletransferase [Benzoatithermus flavus]|uniref:Adenosylcobinamide-GDP ribazoletransferase n=1 Tax=Benzoatithermus flavus TaxID=3108223 RepID=A0ABU8XK48_9PROT